MYEAAINMVGGVLEPYDYDKKFPVFGFGGTPKFSGATTTSHCFPLNGNPANPCVDGIAGMLKIYQSTLLNIGFAGPTYFGPVLKAFQAFVTSTSSNPVYHVGLILTDGTIHDMSATKKFLVELSNLPCSVVIIGIGKADFDDMQELDGDKSKLVDDDGN